VRRGLRAAWRHEDLRHLTPSDQTERLRAYLDADRDQGFDLARGPLARFALHRIGQDAYHFVWTTHHLLIDGWSWPLVFRQVAEAYESLVRQEPIPAARHPRFREYIEWMGRQDVRATEAFWRSELDGFKCPTLVASAARRIARDDGDATVDAHRRLSAGVSDGLRATARRHRVTLSTLVQGAWAVVVSRWIGSSDVVIGAAFSGRPAELPGVESMVGPCVNNLPIRVPVNGEHRIDTWLAGLHERRERVSEHQWTPLAQIQAWTGIPWRLRLFDSLLVFQNYQVGEAALRLGGGVEIHDLVGPDRTNYPLTVFVLPGQDIYLRVAYDGQRLPEARVTRMLDDFEAVLTRLASQETGSVAHLLGAVVGGGLDQETASSAPASVEAYAAPETEVERIIAGIWQEAFAVDRIGVQDNFFDLGGHSLLMVQVHSRLREALKADISIVKLFQYPTVRALARHLADGSASGPSYQDLRGRADRRREALARRAQGARRA
jgi:acyl carrier protein